MYPAFPHKKTFQIQIVLRDLRYVNVMSIASRFKRKSTLGQTGASNDVRRSNRSAIHQFCGADVTVFTELLSHNQFANRLNIETFTIIQGLPVRLANTLL